jgi:DNA-binding winged helix-turn-helix (wHTH) protein
LMEVVLKYQFTEFEIDLSQQELRRLGQAVHIEPQVFDLIVHLVRNHDRIVSKDELIETIWNGRMISEAALSSRINGARRALGDNGNDQALIRTLHKRGFRFVGDVQAIDAAVSVVEANRLVPDVPGGDSSSSSAMIQASSIASSRDCVSPVLPAASSTTALQSRLRAGQIHFTLGPENIAVQICYPLAST